MIGDAVDAAPDLFDPAFDTAGAVEVLDQPATSYTKATTQGFAWTAVSRIAIQIVQFGSTIVLARLLTPNDYGLVAIVTVFAGFAWLFSDLGLGAAIIHRDTVDERILCTAFWINAFAGLLLTVVLAALAFPIAHVYGQNQLAGIMVLLSLNFTLSLSTVHLAQLERAMRFREVARNEVFATLVSVAVTIIAAFAGLGPYSLVLGNLCQTVSVTGAMWASTKWVPRQFADRSSVREIWAYSSHLFGFNVLNYWSRSADNLVVGSAFGPAALGFYSRAYNLMMLPVGQVTSALGRVLFPALSRLRRDQARLRDAYLRSLRVMLAIAVPVAVVLSAAATPFVVVVYGERWRESAVLLALLALSAPAQVVAGTVGPLYQAVGRTKEQFRRGLVSVALTAIAIAVGAIWGVSGVAGALAIKFWVALPVAAQGCWPAIGLTFRRALREAAPMIISGGAMWGVMWLWQQALDGRSMGVQLVAATFSGFVVYGGAMFVLGGSVVTELTGLRRSRATNRHAA